MTSWIRAIPALIIISTISISYVLTCSNVNAMDMCEVELSDGDSSDPLIIMTREHNFKDPNLGTVYYNDEYSSAEFEANCNGERILEKIGEDPDIGWIANEPNTGISVNAIFWSPYGSYLEFNDPPYMGLHSGVDILKMETDWAETQEPPECPKGAVCMKDFDKWYPEAHRQLAQAWHNQNYSIGNSEIRSSSDEGEKIYLAFMGIPFHIPGYCIGQNCDATTTDKGHDWADDWMEIYLEEGPHTKLWEFDIGSPPRDWWHSWIGPSPTCWWVPFGNNWMSTRITHYNETTEFGIETLGEEGEMLDYTVFKDNEEEEFRKVVDVNGPVRFTGGGVSSWKNMNFKFGEKGSFIIEDDTILVISESRLDNPKIVIRNRKPHKCGKQSGDGKVTADGTCYEVFDKVYSGISNLQIFHSKINGGVNLVIEGEYGMENPGTETANALIISDYVPSANPWGMKRTSFDGINLEIEGGKEPIGCEMIDMERCKLLKNNIQPFFLYASAEWGGFLDVPNEEGSSEIIDINLMKKTYCLSIHQLDNSDFGEFIAWSPETKRLSKIDVIYPELHNQPWEATVYNGQKGNFEVGCLHKLIPYEDPNDSHWYEKGLNNACRCEGEVPGDPEGSLYILESGFEGLCRPTVKLYEEKKAEAKGVSDTVAIASYDGNNGKIETISMVECGLGEVPNAGFDGCEPCPTGKYEPASGSAGHGTGKCEWLECDVDEFLNFNECSGCSELFGLGTPDGWYVPNPIDLTGCMECPENMEAAKVSDAKAGLPGTTVEGTYDGGPEGSISYDVLVCLPIVCEYKNMWIENHTCKALCPQDWVVTEDHLKCTPCGPDEYADIESEKCVPKESVDTSQEPKMLPMEDEGNMEREKEIDYFKYSPIYIQKFIEMNGIRV